MASLIPIKSKNKTNTARVLRSARPEKIFSTEWNSLGVSRGRRTARRENQNATRRTGRRTRGMCLTRVWMDSIIERVKIQHVIVARKGQSRKIDTSRLH